MTSRAFTPSLGKLLRSQYAALRRAAVMRHGLRAAAAIAGLIAIAVALGLAWRMGAAGAWVRLALLAAAAGIVLALAVLRTWRTIPRFDVFLESIETRAPELRSLLRNALDLETAGSPHTSDQLAEALRAEAARRVKGEEIAALRPRIAPLRPALALVGAALALVALALVWPAAVERSWATLFSPARAAPPVMLAVEPGSVRLSPGATLSIRARVTGTRLAPRLERGGPHAPNAVDEGMETGAHLWRFDLPPVTREEDYRVRVASIASPRYHITLAGEAQPVSFEVEYRAPAYARLPLQRGNATRGDLTALRGTRAAVEVTFDRDLTALAVHLDGRPDAVRFEARSPRRWRGTLAIEREGEWELTASTRTDATRFRYAIHPLPDAPPIIAVRLPEGDLDLPSGQQIPLEVLGQDDLGLSSLDLEMHKDAASPWQHVTLARFAGEPREAHLASHWDASTLGLLPGESATFRFALYDNNAFGRGVARSGTYTLRFPSLNELYKNVSERQQEAQGSLEKVADQARELQKKLDQLARQAAATPSASPFERREEMKSALERQQDLSRRVDQAAQDLNKSLEQAAERRAFSDELSKKLHEMQQLVNQIQSPEFREALKRIQQALENLDKRALDQSLPDWRRQNQDMLKNLERSIELLKRLRQEEKLDALAHRAEELVRQQEQLNREHEEQKQATPPDASRPEAAEAKPSEAESKPSGSDPKSEASSRDAEANSKRDALAAKQQQAAEQSRKLGEDVRESESQSEQENEKAELDRAAEELDQQAAEEQQEAAKSESQGDPQKAHSRGQSASQSLSSAHRRLSQMAQKMSEERQSVDLAAVRRGAQDLLSLQRESEEDLSSRAPIEGRSDRQTDLSDGVARVADSLATLSRRTPFITPKLGQALGRAMDQLSRSGREMSNGDRAEGERTGRQGSQALAEAVLELRRAESSMCKNPTSSSPGGQTAGEHMSELGNRQSQLNQRSRQITRRLSEQLRMAAGDQGEMRRLAEEQRRIREELEQMQKDENRNQQLLGRLDAARRDMKDVEESLQDGRPGDDLEQKQQRILSRLLDAARSVNRRDFNPDRESRPGEDVARVSPGAIPPELLRETDHLRLDLLKAEADRYPAQYRAYVEAYLRALNGSPR